MNTDNVDKCVDRKAIGARFRKRRFGLKTCVGLGLGAVFAALPHWIADLIAKVIADILGDAAWGLLKWFLWQVLVG